MNRQNYRFDIVPLGGKIAKEDRIRRLVPDFERGGVWVPRSLLYSQYNQTSTDLVKELEMELGSFPFGQHDDMIDALSRIKDPKLAASRPMVSYSKKKGITDWDPFGVHEMQN
jgi:phage terminase large subunit-like protein